MSFQGHCIRIFNKFKRKILNIEIQVSIAGINNLNKSIKELILHHILNKFLNIQFNKMFKRIKNNHIKILTNFYRKQNGIITIEHFNNYDKNSCINLTTKNVIIELHKILSLGPTFFIESVFKSIPLIDIITDAKYIIQNKFGGGQQKSNSKRAQLINIITNFMNKHKKKQSFYKFK